MHRGLGRFTDASPAAARGTREWVGNLISEFGSNLFDHFRSWSDDRNRHLFFLLISESCINMMESSEKLCSSCSGFTEDTDRLKSENEGLRLEVISVQRALLQKSELHQQCIEMLDRVSVQHCEMAQVQMDRIRSLEIDLEDTHSRLIQNEEEIYRWQQRCQELESAFNDKENFGQGSDLPKFKLPTSRKNACPAFVGSATMSESIELAPCVQTNDVMDSPALLTDIALKEIDLIEKIMTRLEKIADCGQQPRKGRGLELQSIESNTSSTSSKSTTAVTLRNSEDILHMELLNCVMTAKKSALRSSNAPVRY